MRCSGLVLPGGGPGEDPGHVVEIISLGWPGKALVFPRITWRKWVETDRSGFSAYAAAQI